MDSDEEDQEILKILAENGIKVIESKKKPQNNITILEDILWYKPEQQQQHLNECSHPPGIKSQEAPMGLDKDALNLEPTGFDEATQTQYFATESGTKTDIHEAITVFDEATVIPIAATIIEDVLIYKPDNELLHAINIVNEYSHTPAIEFQEEAPTGFAKHASNLEPTGFEAAPLPGMQCFDTESRPIAEAIAVFDESTITPIAADYTPRIEVAGFNDAITAPAIATEMIISELRPTTIDTEETLDEPKRKKRAAPKQWKRNVTKEKRMRGECYSGYSRQNKKVTTGVERNERQMGPTCNSRFCKKSTKRFCSKFTEDARTNIFKNFWKELDWNGKQSFVCSMIDRIPIKQRTAAGDSSKRQESLVYYLKLNEETHQICKKMFLNTLGIKERMVLTWISQAKSGITLTETKMKESRRGKKKPTEAPTPIGISQAEHLKKFFEDIPKLPSHYCRSTSTKLYLEPVFESKSHVYSIYKQKCVEDQMKHISACFFYNKFDELNLSVSKPKKDRCDVCCGFETNNVTQEDYDHHIKKKNAARLEKEADKKMALDKKITVLTVDLQSVKVCPKVQASAIYFKTKLCCHNFTVYNLATHEVTCYWWHECEGELQASNFASCLVDYIQENVPKNIPLVIFSDGCIAQNRNSIMANALLDLAMKENMVITQKYLEKGHTQMECDSVHSVIEIKLKKTDIFLPHDYVTLTKDAKKKTPHYDVKCLNHEFFKNYTTLQRYTSIRPGKKAGEPTVTDIRQLQYDPEGKIKYKLNFSDELQELIVRCKRGETQPISAMYSDRIPLKAKKWKDLQDLKCILPRDCHSFYDNLPKTN